jgi:hypothetical protein
MTESERVTSQDIGNLLLDYKFISCRKAMKAVLYLHYTCADFVSCSQFREHCRGHSISFSSVTVKKLMRV